MEESSDDEFEPEFKRETKVKLNAFQVECSELEQKLTKQMNALRDKFQDDTRDFQKHMKSYIDTKVDLFTQEVENKVQGNEIMLNSGTTETANTIAIIRKNVSELHSQLT